MLKKNVVFLIIGITGSLISLIGLTQAHAAFFYVIGSTLLLCTASHFKLLYFIALELILVAGHGAKLLGIGSILQVAIPILLCVQLAVFYLLSGWLNNIYLMIGIAGIATLSIGLSYEDQWIFFIGSTAIAIFAYYYAYKKPVALIWAVMNTIFAITAIVKIIIYR
ncbi:Uncharacterised protein [Legionella beliardensis]|uniref:Transmembrane protein n=1 Tax=Legionella beliardensis TaxID=91822 RepID=A0A378I2J2_9GAMM|nr:hypothetical protein [Legionella beliardensis]STX29162.1 Uncharacterised protein [Legionella beliardensis]